MTTTEADREAFEKWADRLCLNMAGSEEPSPPAHAAKDVVDYPECSGDPKSCPENEGYGCCKKESVENT